MKCYWVGQKVCSIFCTVLQPTPYFTPAVWVNWNKGEKAHLPPEALAACEATTAPLWALVSFVPWRRLWRCLSPMTLVNCEWARICKSTQTYPWSKVWLHKSLWPFKPEMQLPFLGVGVGSIHYIKASCLRANTHLYFLQTCQRICYSSTDSVYTLEIVSCLPCLSTHPSYHPSRPTFWSKNSSRC